MESPYIHRYTAYIKDLQKNWAYKDTGKRPKPKYDNNQRKKTTQQN